METADLQAGRGWNPQTRSITPQACGHPGTTWSQKAMSLAFSGPKEPFLGGAWTSVARSENQFFGIASRRHEHKVQV
jgi:hypothetical protein